MKGIVATKTDRTLSLAYNSRYWLSNSIYFMVGAISLSFVPYFMLSLTSKPQNVIIKLAISAGFLLLMVLVGSRNLKRRLLHLELVEPGSLLINGRKMYGIDKVVLIFDAYTGESMSNADGNLSIEVNRNAIQVANGIRLEDFDLILDSLTSFFGDSRVEVVKRVLP